MSLYARSRESRRGSPGSLARPGGSAQVARGRFGEQGGGRV
ncbi:hypothetical protein JIX56_07460 [Streptomyces sp. CA-210063]|nr:hypothetical protein [Streptomyces sp. CA-210063]UUU29736.1 hypothetical protein JIX56_07460 [Streptomyces sp. CA-210063]